MVLGAQVLLVAGLVGAIYWPTLTGLLQDWLNEPNQSHGLLIPPLAVWAAWDRRVSVLAAKVIPDGRGLLLIGASCILFLLGRLGAEFFLSRISFVALVAGLIWQFWGVTRLRALAMPLLVLATMVPLPALIANTLTVPLQLFASEVASGVAQAVGVMVHRDGNIIQLADVSLGVEEACSGLGSLSTLLVGGVLFGFLICARPLSRIVLLLLTVPLAISVNVARVAGTAILADYNRDLAMGFYHTFSGWLVFLGGLVLLYGVATLLHRWMDPRFSRTEAL